MNKKGFTLIELLIVVAIIGIVAAIAIPNLLVALQKGKQKATMGDMKSVGTALEVYAVDNSFIPQGTLPSLVAVPPATNFFMPFYISMLPQIDGWGTPWLYTFGVILTATADSYGIISYGRDKSVASVIAGMYQVTKLSDFDNNITFANGQFLQGPIVKK